MYITLEHGNSDTRLKIIKDEFEKMKCLLTEYLHKYLHYIKQIISFYYSAVC